MTQQALLEVLKRHGVENVVDINDVREALEARICADELAEAEARHQEREDWRETL
jgi:hypothetical protein